jgi:hypothetical protein
VNTANSIRAILVVLTFVTVPGACLAQALDSQSSANQAPKYQTPVDQAPSYEPSDSQAPNYQAPDNPTPNYETPDQQAPNYQTSDNGTSDAEVSATAPPPLPSYEQPPVPGPGYQWTPGYWGYGVDAGYYWVPGTWVRPPTFGVLWTPGYWGWGGRFFIFHRGFWGPRVGFYGGINYGFGYFGVGFAGGYWHNGAFFYNRAVTNIRNASITNVYNTRVVNRGFGNSRVSHNGGPGGVNLRPTAAEQAMARAAHYPSTRDQQSHEWAARSMPALRASVNHGQPSVAATARPGMLDGRNMTAQSRSADSRALALGRSAQGAGAHRSADRPPWAYRSAAHETARANSAVPQMPGSSMHAARQGYNYPRTAPQPAAHRSAQARSAPSSRYTQRPTYAALAPKSPWRAPASSAPRSPASFRPPNSAASAHAGTQSASHGARHG